MPQRYLFELKSRQSNKKNDVWLVYRRTDLDAHIAWDYDVIN